MPDETTAAPPGLRIDRWVTDTRAEGPHRRFALWVQGCSLRCPGCCNPELFDDTGGRLIDTGTLVPALRAARDNGVEGLTLLGGEPLDQPEAVGWLVEQAHQLGLGVVLFSGYDLAEIQRDAARRRALHRVDTLVDGRYEARQPEPRAGRRVVGSANQSLRHFTSRYADPTLWETDVLAEIRIAPSGAVSVHGAARDVLRTSRKLADPGR